MRYLFPLMSVLLLSCSDGNHFFNSIKPTLSLVQRLNAGDVSNYRVLTNQIYGEDNFQKYDLHLPQYNGDSVAPIVMIVIHGGGWSLLDKSYMNGQIDEFKKLKKNVAIFNINHRLAGVNGNTYDSIIEDLDLLIKHINDSTKALNLSDEIVLYGYSSGGHLVLEFSKLRNGNKNIKVVAASAPPTDLTSEKLRNAIIDDKNRNLTELLIGESYKENPKAYKEASPYFKVSKMSKPTILFYGENDAIVDKDQVQKLSNLLTQNDVDNRLIGFKDTGHEMPKKQAEIALQIYKFVNER